MGLDMYLIKKVNDKLNVPKNGFAFHGFWRTVPEGTVLFHTNDLIRLNGAGNSGSLGGLLKTISSISEGSQGKGDFEKVFSWRKSNQIHGWFVKNVQRGRDNGKVWLVKSGQLNKLKEACEAVLKNKKLAPQILPLSDGFLYGTREYDEYYFDDIKETVEMLNSINLEKEYYYDSWF